MSTSQRFVRVGLLVGALWCSSAAASAQEIPSPAQVLGYDLGEQFTPVAGIVHYFYRLAEASPLVSVHPYGETYQGRPLLQVLIASPAHRARLEEILAKNRELTLPETSEARAREIIRTNPAVVYLSYGVHGNEASSPEAALWTAYDLARGAPDVAWVLDSVLVVIDPVLNPDGRDLYVNEYRRLRGRTPNPNPRTQEHQVSGGRTNHYGFDLNRDWAWATQKETQQRLATWDRWNPQIHADLHEMGYDATYFFFPPAKPINPLYPSHILEWAERIGAGNAAAFNERGWLYYTAQGFDLFYPGYGDSWPSLFGAIGMTYEMAGGGSAGLVVERQDGSLLTLKDRAERHWVASKATIRTAAAGRTDLLTGFAEFFRKVDEGIRDILLVPGQDPSRLHALLDHLARQGIRVERAAQPFQAQAEPHPGYASRRSFPEGTIRVPVRQPRGRLAAALLQPDQLLDAESSYDITAWSLAYAYGVEAHTLTGAVSARFEPFQRPSPPAASLPSGPLPYGYLMLPRFEVMPPLVRFLKAGGRVRAQPDTFRVAGTLYPLGTFFFPREGNPDLDRKLQDAGLAPYLIPVSSAMTETGLDLGTGSAARIRLPKVGLVGATGGGGTHWFFLEHFLDLPFDALPASAVGEGMEDYDVLILTEAAGRLSDQQNQALSAWVRAGGTLVAVGSSAVGIGSAFAEVKERRAEEEQPKGQELLARALRSREERRRDRWEENIPGTILKVKLDRSHPLSAGAGADGLDGEMFVLTRGRSFEPATTFESVVYFPKGGQKIGGVIFDKGLQRLEQSTWLAYRTLGRGKVILFAEDPLFRLFWYSGFQLYANALLLGPGL